MQLLLTKKIQIAINNALKYRGLEPSDEAKAAVQASLEDEPLGVSLTLVQQTVETLAKTPDKVWLHDLMHGSGVYVEPKPKPPRNPALDEYLEKLRADKMEMEYNRMISSVLPGQNDMFRIRPDDLKEIKSHVVTIFNIIFSMVAVFVAVYTASKTMTHDVGLH
ncbi:hypothetical protein EC973_005375 [Apophysomyces ossiformis]|uniref:Uncharacterized protein n=1 Tax=Apophysomyces ossiformis TaxID=679940 RepID=A0A8H7BG61_9FUNG|nr:hypothetical protein EC973_005375 [Apophysomyces ossiformis]